MKTNKQTAPLNRWGKYVNGLFLLLATFQIYGQGGMQFSPGVAIACPMGTTDAHSRHGMHMDRDALLQKESTAEFIIQFGDGFENNLEAREAFEFATEIWAREVVSSVPIRVAVRFANFPVTGVIATAQATYSVSNFPNAPEPSLFYAGALANAIAQQVLQPEANSEISITFGADINFYFGIDGNTPSQQTDFATVSLHEIAHGLGFAASVSETNNQGSFTSLTDGPVIFNNFLTGNDNKQALELRNSGVELGDFLTSEAVFFSGNNAISANSNVPPPLFAPASFAAGSSISHWDEDTYPIGDPNSLMTPARQRSESIFNIGDITRGLLKDIGWELNNPKLFPISVSQATGDLEVLQGRIATQNLTIKNVSNEPLNYSVNIRSNIISENFAVTNGENIALQPNEEKTIAIAFDTSEVESGLFTIETNITNTLSEFSTQQELNFVVLNGSETAIINTIDALEENFAVVNELDDSFRIANIGNRVLNYTIAVENDELSLLNIAESQGTVIPNDFSIIKYNINREGIAAGTYNSEIIITSNAANTPTLTIPVKIIVRDTLNPPSFDITISRELNVTVEVDETTDVDQASVTFDISNSGELPLEFNLVDTDDPLIRALIDNPNDNVLEPGATVQRTITIIPGINTVDTNFSSEIILTSNDPSMTELRIPLNVTITRKRGRLQLVPNLAIPSNTIELGNSVNNIVEFVNTGLAPISVTEIFETVSSFEVLDWSSESGDAIVEIGERLIIKTRLELRSLPRRGNVFTRIRIVSDATPNQFFSNSYDTSDIDIVEGSGLVASELLLIEEVNLNSLRDTSNLIRNQIVEITNIEDKEIAYTVNIEGDENSIFSIDETSGVLAPNETRAITVTFNATNVQLGDFDAQIVIRATTPEVQDAIINTNLIVTNQEGSLVIQPESFTDFFDSFVEGGFELVNISRTPIEITNIEIENATFQDLFAFTDSGQIFPSELLVVEPGESIFIDVFYIPTTKNRNNIIVTSNVSNTKFLIPVDVEFPEDLEPIILGYQLIDVTNNVVVETFFDGATVDLATYENPVALVALTGVVTPASVVFDYGKASGFRVDNSAPFSLGKNLGDKLLPFNFSLGEQRISASPFSDANGEGQEFAGVTFDFNFIDSRLPFITDFVLVDATTNETIRPIEDGEVLDLNTFDTRSFNIVALLDKPSKSVTFNSNGRRRFDLFAPFSVGGDFKGDFRDLTFAEGENTLKASSNSIVRGRGLVSGNPKTINFTVIPLEPLATVNKNSTVTPFLVIPNPVVSNATFNVNIHPESNFKITINGLLNQPINSEGRVFIDQEGNGAVNLSGLINGLYILTITDTSNGKVFRARMLKK